MLRRLMTISAAAALLAGCYYDMDEIPYTGDNVTGVDVVTIAGTGSPGSKDGAATKEATFKVPGDVAADAKGRIFVADMGNHLIRMIHQGQVTTFAGTGKPGTGGNTRNTVQFKFPAGVVVHDGKLYVADAGNNRIVRIDGDKAEVYAGTGKLGVQDGGAAAATFAAPTGVAADSAGNIYVTDTGSGRIRKITTGKQVVTITGKKSTAFKNSFADGSLADAKFNNPLGIAVDSKGVIYVADSSNHRIRRITATAVDTFAGTGNPSRVDGAATSAQFNKPYGIAVDSNGSVYVSGELSHRIRRIDNGNVVTIAGTGMVGHHDGPGTDAVFNAPGGLAVNDGSLLVADKNSHTIRSITP